MENKSQTNMFIICAFSLSVMLKKMCKSTSYRGLMFEYGDVYK